MSGMVAKQRCLTLLHQDDRDKGDPNLCDKKGNGSASLLVVTSFLPLQPGVGEPDTVASQQCLKLRVDDCRVLMGVRGTRTTVTGLILLVSL
jgi:hypothetical protein